MKPGVERLPVIFLYLIVFTKYSEISIFKSNLIIIYFNQGNPNENLQTLPLPELQKEHHQVRKLQDYVFRRLGNLYEMCSETDKIHQNHGNPVIKTGFFLIYKFFGIFYIIINKRGLK